MKFVKGYMFTVAVFLGLSVLGFATSLPAYAEAEGDYKLIYKEKCGMDAACNVDNYCTGCHEGLIVGKTIINKGRMRPAPGNYDEWLSRLQRMSVMGGHIPSVLIPIMATYLDSLDNAPLTAKGKAQAIARAKAEAKAFAKNPGKFNVEKYCIGCHDGLVVGSTVIGAGHIKPRPKTYDEWVSTTQQMSVRKSGTGAHIPPALIPDMAAYLDSLDNNLVTKAPTKRPSEKSTTPPNK